MSCYWGDYAHVYRIIYTLHNIVHSYTCVSDIVHYRSLYTFSFKLQLVEILGQGSLNDVVIASLVKLISVERIEINFTMENVQHRMV